jgi:putative lipoic acid-binding regulatory protein
MSQDSLLRFKETLDEHHSFPCAYVFKFIVPLAKFAEVVELLKGFKFTTRESRTGKYISFTAELHMESSESVISIYRAAASIEGLIAL